MYIVLQPQPQSWYRPFPWFIKVFSCSVVSHCHLNYHKISILNWHKYIPLHFWTSKSSLMEIKSKYVQSWLLLELPGEIFCLLPAVYRVSVFLVLWPYHSKFLLAHWFSSCHSSFASLSDSCTCSLWLQKARLDNPG